MGINLQKYFGIGPIGAFISILLLILFAWGNKLLNYPSLPIDPILSKYVGVTCFILGLGLHFWSFLTLRKWWIDDQLCTQGPFRYFRHPMYAAWITFISLGVVFYFDSWVFFIWQILLHIIWHKLVREEELSMLNTFEDVYINYANRTGRFIPNFSRVDKVRITKV